MKKKNLFYCLAVALLLVSCNDNPKHSSSSSSSSSNSSSVDNLYIKDDTIIDVDNIVVGLNKNYYVPIMCREDVRNSWFDYLIEDKSVVAFQMDETIKGIKEGTTNVKIIIDETYYDEITITVLGEDKMKTDFKTSLGNLYGKKFLVFGSSTSDVTVTAYPDNRPKFWCEQLVEKANMTMYNYAYSGSTVGYCKGLFNQGNFTHIIGTTRVNDAREDIKKSDIAFIYYGNNDATYGCNLGDYGDVDETNYRTKESFRGAYSYIIDTLRKYNPTIEIVCLSLTYTTWPINPADETVNYAKTDKEMYDVVQEIAEKKECKFINIFDLWNNQTISKHCPDGRHPQTSGYELLVNRILEN